MKKLLNNTFTTLTAGLFILWLIMPDNPYWEATIGILFIAKEVVIRWQMRKIDSLEFSPAISLAHGYVNNFLEPAINEILLKNGASVTSFKIYIPDELDELSDQHIDRMKLEIKSKGYQLNEIKLKRKTGRPHDLLTVEKHAGSLSYFDFPRTLLSLQSYIDYKVESSKNESLDSKKQMLGTKLIKAFRDEVQRLVEKKKLGEMVTYVNETLDI